MKNAEKFFNMIRRNRVKVTLRALPPRAVMVLMEGEAGNKEVHLTPENILHDFDESMGNLCEGLQEVMSVVNKKE